MIVRRRGDWLAANVADEVLMMSAENGLYLGLNAVAARIWQLLETPRDIDSLCSELEQEFAVVPDVCQKEVRAFLDELVRYRVIAIEATPES